MTDKFTLPNGDMLYEGDYGVTGGGQKVGPIEISPIPDAFYKFKCEGYHYGHNGRFYEEDETSDSDIIAKWVDTPTLEDDSPTLWRDMTPEQKGALLLAHHEGMEIEVANWYEPRGWSWKTLGGVTFHSCLRYRIKPSKPEPKVTAERNEAQDELMAAQGQIADAQATEAKLPATDAQVKALVQALRKTTTALTALVDDEDVGNWSQYKWDNARAAIAKVTAERDALRMQSTDLINDTVSTGMARDEALNQLDSERYSVEENYYPARIVWG
jgi:hypothetical protein